MVPRHGGPKASIIETIPDLEGVAWRLREVKELAVDMESDSFYVYHEKICLLQLSTREEDFIIDPLAVKDMSPLGPIFRDPGVEKVFHAGEYDILCLKRDYGFEIVNVFDTMIAARTLGADKLGLAPAIEKHFGVKLSKKLQRADWGKRPLTLEQLEYARLDTHYLLRLRDILRAELEQKGLLQEALEEFARLSRIEPGERTFDPEGFWNLSGARELSPQARAVLRGLYLYRERRAAELDRAPFRVLPEDLLVRIAQNLPREPEELRKVRGMTPYLFSRFGKDILAEVEKGLQAPPAEKPPERPEGARWDGPTLRRYEALRLWRKQQADKRGVNPVVILATEEVRALAEAPHKSSDPASWLEHLSAYKRELYGKDILEVLSKPPPETGRPRRRRRRKRRGGSAQPQPS